MVIVRALVLVNFMLHWGGFGTQVLGQEGGIFGTDLVVCGCGDFFFFFLKKNLGRRET